MNLKGKFPFRIGATSYIIPGDILSNVNYVSQMVDDVEIVVFESDEISKLPDNDSITTLRQIALSSDLTYTIHLPLDIRIGDSDQLERRKSVDKCRRVIERMQPLMPLGFILHCHIDFKNTETKADAAYWQMNIEKSIDELLLCGLPSEKLCIETLDFPFELIEPIIEAKNVGICLDIGHILLNGFPIKDYLIQYFNKSRIIHLHGVWQGRDHCDISMIDQKCISLLLKQLHAHKESNRVVTLEVFNKIAFDKSLAAMERFAA